MTAFRRLQQYKAHNTILCYTQHRATGFKMLFLTGMLLAVGLYVGGADAKEGPDLTGYVLTFPKETVKSFIKLVPSGDSFGALTVCYRLFTDLTRDYVPFSLATHSLPNAFMTFFSWRKNEIYLFILNHAIVFEGLKIPLNQYVAFCATWDSATGLAQVWIDGKPSNRKHATENQLVGVFSLILGQDQDAFGGGFDLKQSFVGSITDLYVYSSVLPTCALQDYVAHVASGAVGDVINWKDLIFETHGKVVQENEQICET